MLIRFLTSVAGANFSYRPKQEVDLPDAFAQQFIRSQAAEAIHPEPAVAADPAQESVRRVRRGGKSAETTARRGARETR